MYKIPGRMIVCDTVGSWIKEMLWVYVIMKVFKTDIAAITGNGYSIPPISE
jgi:hypothetical protein